MSTGKRTKHLGVVKSNYTEPFRISRADKEPLHDLANCRFCLICGVIIHDEMTGLHTEWHEQANR